jgi:hypothetical protein
MTNEKIMPLILCIIFSAVSLISFLIIIAKRGIKGFDQKLSPLSVVLLSLTFVLIPAAIYFGCVANQQRSERRTFDESLVKMFGRSPDRLDLQGNEMSNFHGTAAYGPKTYTLETKIYGMSNAGTSYQVIATPGDAEK